MKAVLPTLAALAVVSLAACDEPKRRSSPPQADLPPAALGPAVAPTPSASAGLAKLPGYPGFSLDTINRANDPLNAPATISAAGPVTFAGFGFDPVAKAPAGGIDIVVDGVTYGTTYGHQRKDVGLYYKTPTLENSGFTVTLPAGVIKPGQHQVVVRVVSADKKGYFDGPTIGFVAQ